MHRFLIDGRPASTLPIDDRGLAYGDGLFETIAVRGGRLRFLEAHLARLGDGCRRLGLPAPDPAMLAAELAGLGAGHARAVIKLVLTAGSGPRGYARPVPVVPRRIASLTPAPPPDRAAYRDGVAVLRCRTPLSVNPALAGLKTLNRLDTVLARTECAAAGAAEGLMGTGGGDVVCGTMSNVFAVVDGRLVTPPLERAGVRGIMRAIVLDTAAALGLAPAEAPLDAALLASAGELFLTNSQFGLWPVAAVDGRPRPVGPLTRRLLAALAARGIDECAG